MNELYGLTIEQRTKLRLELDIKGVILRVTLLVVLMALSVASYADVGFAKAAYQNKNYNIAYKEIRGLLAKDPEAQYLMGDMLRNGFGVSNNPYSAIKWFIKAASLGDVLSMHALGEMFHSGELETKNYIEARSWFKKSAEKGNVKSQVSLGMMMIGGRGGEKNTITGLAWLALAKEKGSPDAKALYEVNSKGLSANAKNSVHQQKKKLSVNISDAVITQKGAVR